MVRHRCTAPLVTMKSNTCPFCGVVTDIPHETQQGCIDALHAEIARMREILDAVKQAESLAHPPERADRR
jgi:hypothetical protein